MNKYNKSNLTCGVKEACTGVHMKLNEKGRSKTENRNAITVVELKIDCAWKDLDFSEVVFLQWMASLVVEMIYCKQITVQNRKKN